MFRPSRASLGIKNQFFMPDEARDGRNVALKVTSVHGESYESYIHCVLDCPKKNQAISCIICCTGEVHISYCKLFGKHSYRCKTCMHILH